MSDEEPSAMENMIAGKPPVQSKNKQKEKPSPTAPAIEPAEAEKVRTIALQFPELFVDDFASLRSGDTILLIPYNMNGKPYGNLVVSAAGQEKLRLILNTEKKVKKDGT